MRVSKRLCARIAHYIGRYIIITFTRRRWVTGMSHRVFGDGNLSSSFCMALISGTAGSCDDKLASELMNSAFTIGRWNGPALSGRGTNDWSDPAHASLGDRAQHELASVANPAARSSSSSTRGPPESTDVFGRPDEWPPEVAEDLKF